MVTTNFIHDLVPCALHSSFVYSSHSYVLGVVGGIYILQASGHAPLVSFPFISMKGSMGNRNQTYSLLERTR